MDGPKEEPLPGTSVTFATYMLPIRTTRLSFAVFCYPCVSRETSTSTALPSLDFPLTLSVSQSLRQATRESVPQKKKVARDSSLSFGYKLSFSLLYLSTFHPFPVPKNLSLSSTSWSFLSKNSKTSPVPASKSITVLRGALICLLLTIISWSMLQVSHKEPYREGVEKKRSERAIHTLRNAISNIQSSPQLIITGRGATFRC